MSFSFFLKQRRWRPEVHILSAQSALRTFLMSGRYCERSTCNGRPIFMLPLIHLKRAKMAVPRDEAMFYGRARHCPNRKLLPALDCSLQAGASLGSCAQLRLGRRGSRAISGRKGLSCLHQWAGTISVCRRKTPRIERRGIPRLDLRNIEQNARAMKGSALRSI